MNRTPKVNETSATVLERSKLFRIAGIFVVIGLIFGGLFIYDNQKTTKCELTINKQCITLEHANSAKERDKGLGGHQKLAMNSAMLFTFEKEGKYCFWMKDMKFDLDIIWINSKKQVVAMEKDVKPSTYPDSFCPEKHAQYVLEGTQGFVDLHKISIGQQLSF